MMGTGSEFLDSDYAPSSRLISNMFDILSHLLEHTLAAFPLLDQKQAC